MINEINNLRKLAGLQPLVESQVTVLREGLRERIKAIVVKHGGDIDKIEAVPGDPGQPEDMVISFKKPFSLGRGPDSPVEEIRKLPRLAHISQNSSTKISISFDDPS